MYIYVYLCAAYYYNIYERNVAYTTCYRRKGTNETEIVRFTKRRTCDLKMKDFRLSAAQSYNWFN